MRAACALVERGHAHVWEYGMSLFLAVVETAATAATLTSSPA